MSELHWDAPEKPAELAEKPPGFSHFGRNLPIDSNLPPKGNWLPAWA